MNKKVYYSLWAMMSAFSMAFMASCSDEDEPEPTPEPENNQSNYIYVLNSGKWGSNNATLSTFKMEDSTFVADVFEERNGRKLGDTGQDIAAYGSKLYIAMSGESTIEVTDLDAKSIKQIQTDGQPRALVAYGGKIYVTYYNGYVARLDTASLEVEATVAVGRNPEQMAVANGKLYVANSGGMDYSTELGYDKTVSVIDIASFTETKKLDVVINPCNVVSDGGDNVFVASFGNYGDIPSTLQKINAKTDEVAVVSSFNGTYMAVTGDTLYSVHSQYDANWNLVATYYSYDIAGDKVLSDNFIGATSISNFYQISSDAASGDVFITTSDYVNNGDIYVFDSSGALALKFEVGLNPMKAIKVAR